MHPLIQKRLFLSLAFVVLRKTHCDVALRDGLLLFSSDKTFYHRAINRDETDYAKISSTYDLALRSMGLDSNAAQTDVDMGKDRSFLYPDIFRVSALETFGIITLEGFAPNILNQIAITIGKEMKDFFLQTFDENFKDIDRLFKNLLSEVESQGQFACSSFASAQICQENGAEISVARQNPANNVKKSVGENIDAETQIVDGFEELEYIVSLPQQKRFFIAHLKSTKSSHESEVAEMLSKYVASLFRNFQERTGLHTFQIITKEKDITAAQGMTTLERRQLLTFSDITDGSKKDSSSGETNNTQSTISMNDIAQYQIVLWTTILLASMLLLTVVAMSSLGNNRDSLLHAKFITNTNQRRLD